MKYTVISDTIKRKFVVRSLTFRKIHFIPEQITHESTCTAHLNKTQFSFTKPQPAMFRRSAACSQERIRADLDPDVIYDVTGYIGWILGVPDL
jgi:hypothetical protein